MMELFIETLTGTAFELRVSPFETIMSVKAKIQRLEEMCGVAAGCLWSFPVGKKLFHTKEQIPISHQHLIWQSVELEDEYCLHDYSIQSGATLKLVLAMRGGPINTRRIPVEDSTLREMAEYMEANRDEILDKLPGNRHVTLLVFREGDQLNFFRVVDRGDGTLTPLSESLSASVYNLNEEEEEEEAPTKEKLEENDKLKEKMMQLRVNMEKMNLGKKHQKKPSKPPSSGHSGRSSQSSRMRLRQLPSAGRPFSRTLNKNTCLPPVGKTFSASSSMALETSEEMRPLEERQRLAAQAEKLSAAALNELPLSAASDKLSCGDTPFERSAKLSSVLDVVKEKEAPLSRDQSRAADCSGGTEAGDEGDLEPPTPLPQELGLGGGLSPSGEPGPSMCQSAVAVSPLLHKEHLDTLKDSFHAAAAAAARERTKKKAEQHSLDPLSESHVGLRPPLPGKKDLVLDSLRDTFMRPTTSSRYSGRERHKEFALESLSSSEARAMSGILRQASIEKIGSSHIGNFVSSASKSRLSNYSLSGAHQDGRIPTPETRLSSRLQRVSASRDGRLMSPSHRLPPVKAKKKATKRCYVCGKKTGLATSYQCRCGNNFCASHRYAESHDCTFDYKTEGRKLLEQNNPVVSAPKLPKI